MRQSGLADGLPLLRREVAYVGTSGGAMVATPDFGGATYDDSEPLTGSDRALGLVDFSLFPHLEREDMPDTTLANIERWAVGACVCDRRSDRDQGGRRHCRSRLGGAVEALHPRPEDAYAYFSLRSISSIR